MRLLSISIMTAAVLAAGFPVLLHTSNGGVHANTPRTYEELQRTAQSKNLPPVDAKINKSGRTNVIPELNGLEVDVDATWKHMKADGRDGISYVYRQVPPKICMRDLPPMPIYQGNPQKKAMALMINVAWGTEYLEGILRVLNENQVKATFFVDGSWLAKNREMGQRLVAGGHEIGNHAYTHPDMARLSAAKQEQQIVRTQKEIKDALGVESKWFAPPSGSYNETTLQTAKRHGMGTIMWTLDTVDWKRPPQEVIVNRIVPNVTNAALVLMHPTEPTLQALRTIVPQLKQKGYKLVTVSELVSPLRSPE